MKNLTLNLKREYFEAIKAGTKTREYRLYNGYWIKRLVDKKYDIVTFCLGYPKKDNIERRLVKRYKGYEITTIEHKEFGDKPIKVFAIDFEELL